MEALLEQLPGLLPLAYLDPAAGSAVLALLAGGFTGLVLLFKLGGQKLKTLFKKTPPEHGIKKQDSANPGKIALIYSDGMCNRERR